MPRLLIPGLLLLAGCAANADAPPAAKGLAVHEWGVFRVHEDAAMANADLRAAWDDLPDWVHGNVQGRGVPQHWGVLEIRDRPLIFFHADRPVRARVKVEFPGGLPGVWWPSTRSPSVMGHAKPPAVGTPLEWDLAVKAPPPGWESRSRKDLPKGHWMDQARAVKCDEVFARFSDNPHDVECEHFVYYDGLFPQGKWLRIDVGQDAVALTNRVKHAVFDVTVVDRRAEGKARVGRLAKLDAGASVASVPFTESDPAAFAGAAAATLVKQLTAAGLFDDEAKLLADLYRKDLFERPGLHVFYRIPPEEYDRLLPLTVTPRPAQVVRVGLVHHAHVEPDFAERVRGLVRRLDADDFKAREAAEGALRVLGPAALPHLVKAMKAGDLSPEAKRRVGGLLKDWSAREAFD